MAWFWAPDWRDISFKIVAYTYIFLVLCLALPLIWLVEYLLGWRSGDPNSAI